LCELWLIDGKAVFVATSIVQPRIPATTSTSSASSTDASTTRVFGRCIFDCRVFVVVIVFVVFRNKIHHFVDYFNSVSFIIIFVIIAVIFFVVIVEKFNASCKERKLMRVYPTAAINIASNIFTIIFLIIRICIILAVDIFIVFLLLFFLQKFHY
jgi:hypothetical protein